MLAGLILSFLGASGPVRAQSDYPNRTIRIVSPYAVGGSSDYMARVLAKFMSESLKQTVLVENRPGASGTTGTDWVAKSPADGYTFLFGSIATNVIAPLLYPNIPYDGVADFAPVSLVATSPSLLVVRNDSPIRSARDLLKRSSLSDRELTYGSSGAGSIAHLTTELFAHKTKTRMVHVPYKGDAPGLTDVMGGQIDFMFGALPSAMPHVRNGRLRPVAVSSAERSTFMPEVPTVSESGVPGFEVMSWWMLLAPAKVPPEILARVNEVLREGLKRPDVVESFRTQGVDLHSTTVGNAKAYLQKQWKAWAEDVASAGIKLN